MVSCAVSPRSPATPAFLRAAVVMGGLTLFSRVLGLLRDMGMAWLLGSSAMADTLVAAMRLPHALRRLLGEGSLSMTMTACLVQQGAGLASPQMQTLFPLTVALAWRLGLSLLLLTLVGFWAAPWLAVALTPGFSDLELAVTAELLRVCLPYVLAAGMAALAMAVLHTCHNFWLPALSPAIFNLSMLAATATAALCPWEPAAVLAWGMLLGGLGQCLLQWLGLRRALPGLGGACLASERQGWGRAAWRCLGQLPSGVLGAAAPQLSMLAAMGVASSLGEGRISALYYAERLLELPMGLVGACLGMASLPVLSRLAVQHDFMGFSQRLTQAMRWSLLLSLPAAAGLWAVGPQLVEALLRHGAFHEEAVRETALALGAYVPSLPAFACNRCLLAGCNALGLARHTALSTGATVLITLAAALILRHGSSYAAAEWLSVMGPALAVGIGSWCQVCLLALCLKRALRYRGQKVSLVHGGILCRQAGAALMAGLAAWSVLACFSLGLWSSLILAIACGIMAWLAGLCLWCQEELAALRLPQQDGV